MDELVAGQKISFSIRTLLDSHGVDYDFMEHEETPTSADSARVRGTKMEEGVKALIFKGKKSGIQVMLCIPGNAKVDTKLVKQLMGEKIEMESPDVIFDQLGLRIGGIPPFGNMLGIKTLMDPEVLKESKAAFNCGLRTHSIIMKSKDLIEVTQPQLEKITKN